MDPLNKWEGMGTN